MSKAAILKKRARGRPRSIDRETVLAAAMELVDPDLSLPELAESLDINLAAIYRIFGDKVGLYTAMYAEALRQLDRIEGTTWTSWLDSYVNVLLKLARRYPFVVSLQASHKNHYVELRNLSERSVALVSPGIELLVKAGLDREMAHNALIGVKAIVYEHALTEQFYSEAPVILADFETLGGSGEQRLWKFLKVIRNGLQAEMKSAKGK
ncbi:MAG TPA: TetR/AcrR family transcriptional regulator [Nevskiaceae bacterium]|nr:TetR/AcrR family transcriptional regulator [Nevskiaceae bacterium]